MKTLITIILTVLFTQLVCAQRHTFDTTLVINKQSFQVKSKDINSDLILLTATCDSQTALNDTIDSGGLSDLQFLDFNKDGASDIMLTYMGNNDTYVLYMFDPTTNKFRYIDGFINYPDAIQLKSNPKYYYSYHRAGCADMDWVSDLFKIDENFKTIQIGHIYGQGCDTPMVIEIYKVTDNSEDKRKLIEKLPYLKHIPTFGDKWSFIKKYWNKNYGKFE